MSKIHAQEIKRWADCEEGTKVWQKDLLDGEWMLLEVPDWRTDQIYIVDDKYAKFRKAQVDGKIIQHKPLGQYEWRDRAEGMKQKFKDFMETLGYMKYGRWNKDEIVFDARFILIIVSGVAIWLLMR